MKAAHRIIWKHFPGILLLLLTACSQESRSLTLRTDVLVIGSGVSGSTAGIQSARMGVSTIVTGETPWLGGMISAAGVSAFDGNESLHSGFWMEFRNLLARVYGGPDKLKTGWVSNIMFEPHVADSILKSIAAGLPDLKLLTETRFEKVIKKGNRIEGAEFRDLRNGRTIRIYARQIIDATEMADVAGEAGIPCDVGRDDTRLTGEPLDTRADSNAIQDLTYVAILKDYGPGKDCTLVVPQGYDPHEFEGCCRDYNDAHVPDSSSVNAAAMLSYGQLPHGKYMINWPAHANDFYLNLVHDSPEQRAEKLQAAKEKTLRFVYFLQHQLGFRQLGLADDEYNTADRLPLIPYYREGRRVKGMVRLRLNDLLDPFNQQTALYRTAIAVGDYPVDHHHKEYKADTLHLHFPSIPSFSLPLGALIPRGYDGIIVAEKGISVTHLVNGTTRLQPVTMLVGQAAAALAVYCVQHQVSASEVPVRAIQDLLLGQQAYLMPYIDVKPEDPDFLSIQRLGATGIIRGVGEPYKWANRTWFYPDSLADAAAFARDFHPFGEIRPAGQWLTGRQAREAILSCVKKFPRLFTRNRDALENADSLSANLSGIWNAHGWGPFRESAPLSRRQLAVLLDKTLDPFHRFEVDWEGNIKMSEAPKQ